MRFRGVFAADRVPESSSGAESCPSRWCCVANTDPYDQPGEHWVALLFDDAGGAIEYFDPYGMPLESYPALCRRLRRVSVTCQAAAPVQPPLSSTCGHFCIYYLCCRGTMSLARIVRRLLDVPVRARDAFVLAYVCRLTSTLGVRRPCRRYQCKGSQCCRPRMMTQ